MTITDITQQVKNKKRYSVFVDGSFAFGIDGIDLLCHGLEIGQRLDKDYYDKMLNHLEYAKCRDSAVKYLGTGLKSICMTRKKLASKEFSPASIEKVITLLQEKGYLDDIVFAKAFISHKTKINNFGRRRIEQELRAKGVSNKNINTAFGKSDGASDLEAARRALQKKLRNKDINLIADNPKELQKIKMFLMRRGFDFYIIDHVINEMGEENGNSRPNFY